MTKVLLAVRQAWWAPVAAALVVCNVVVGLVLVFANEDSGSRIWGGLFIASGFVILVGLLSRLDRRTPGNVLILLGTVPSLLVFWLIVPVILAVVVVVGVLKDGWTNHPAVNPRVAG